MSLIKAFCQDQIPAKRKGNRVFACSPDDPLASLYICRLSLLNKFRNLYCLAKEDYSTCPYPQQGDEPACLEFIFAHMSGELPQQQSPQAKPIE